MPYTVPCTQCDQPMSLSVKPGDRRPKRAPGWDRTEYDEWLCPNGHHRDLTPGESRAFD